MVLYFIKSTFLLLIFFLIYKWNLENKKALRFRRFYLLISLVLALSIPLLKFQFAVTQNVVAETKQMVLEQIPDLIPLQEISVETKENISVALVLYLMVCSIFLIRFGYNINKILKLKRTGKTINSKFGPIITHRQIKTPFTFLNCIYVNKENWKKREVDQAILFHEQAHVQQKHTLDVLFIEILKIFFWFQPLIYFYKRIIQENHEYLADDFSLQKTLNLNHYQTLILNYYSKEPVVALSSSIHFNNLKKRFIMMKNVKKGRVWQTVFYSLTVLITYSTLVGIEAKATEIKKIESKVSNLIESTVKDFDEKVIDKRDSNDDKEVVLEFKKGENTTGSFKNPADNNVYLYIISSDQSSVLVGELKENNRKLVNIEELGIAYKLVEQKESKKSSKIGVSQNNDNDLIVLQYIKGEQYADSFVNPMDDAVYFYIVKADKEVLIYNRYGVKQSNDRFTYKLEEKTAGQSPQERVKNDYEENKIIENEIQKLSELGEIDTKAEPKEGILKFMQDFVKEFNIPKGYSEDEIKIRLKFIVEKDGSLSGIHSVGNNVNPLLADEAIRVLESMPNWNPAQHDGETVRSTFILPIAVRINSK